MKIRERGGLQEKRRREREGRGKEVDEQKGEENGKQ